VANILARTALLLHPVMPKTTQKIADALGFEISPQNFERFVERGELLEPFTIKKIPPLFPRIEEPLMEERRPEPLKESKKEPQELITIEDFFKTQLRTGRIIEAEEIPKSKKLLKLKVDLGEEQPRQIIAGIKEHYSPDDLVGKDVVVVANLKPAKLMGHLSEGMILAASDGSGLHLVRPEAPKEPGTPVK